jgi:hypothetical protein
MECHLESGVMPRFFLHLRLSNGHLIEDTDGAEFADFAACEEEACASARELMAHALLQGKLVDASEIVIGDHAGRSWSSIDLDISLILDRLRTPQLRQVLPASAS